MAQDSEKRFTSIMDKLFQPTKSTPSSSSNGSGVEELRRGKKWPNPESALALVEPKAMLNVMERYQHSSASASAGLPQTPICKPWDRGDLMRRLATFKSMTWFAKPKVVSAVNCARRGWVNVDTDTIACESCGARLLFSTPSSWTRQQVEKAALVFSLKLDSGHKLLCPWIDNICDETLAQFPPMPPPVLVDKFRERSAALLQLLALPVISPSAIEYMKSTQLEEFLKWVLILECGNESTRGSQTDSLGNQCHDHSANLYYQAQKLISLCGWEPRSLPYLVDCEDGVSQFVKDVTGQNPNINVHSAGSNEIVEVTEYSGAHKSVVLDCRLCGASVGLWAFSTVARPVEFFRIIGYAEVNSENRFGTDGSGNENLVDNRGAVINTASNDEPLHKESSSHLNLTIAGGPPPTKQNFKATISLPVIGRALRAKFSCDYDFRDYSSDHPKEIQSGSRNKNLLLEGKDHTGNNLTGQIVQAEDTGLLSRRQDDHGSDSSINEDSLGKENNNHMPADGPSVTGQDTFSGAGTGTGHAIIHGSDSSINEDTLEKENNNHMPAEGPSVTGQDTFSGAGTGHAIIHGSDSSINEDTLEKENNDHMPAEGPSVTGQDTFSGAGTSHAIIQHPTETTQNVILGHIQNDLLPENAANVYSAEGKFGRTEATDSSITFPDASLSIGNGIHRTNERSLMIPSDDVAVAGSTGKDPKQQWEDKAMKFDPIRQHRHFCPWIVSTGGESPGWQQTLYALHRQREGSPSSPAKSPPSSSVIKVDDPVGSVRKLFMSPVSKRMKSTLGSS